MSSSVFCFYLVFLKRQILCVNKKTERGQWRCSLNQIRGTRVLQTETRTGCMCITELSAVQVNGHKCGSVCVHWKPRATCGQSCLMCPLSAWPCTPSAPPGLSNMLLLRETAPQAVRPMCSGTGDACLSSSVPSPFLCQSLKSSFTFKSLF